MKNIRCSDTVELRGRAYVSVGPAQIMMQIEAEKWAIRQESHRVLEQAIWDSWEVGTEVAVKFEWQPYFFCCVLRELGGEVCC